jgi:P-type Ca2+ transporter type 2C
VIVVLNALLGYFHEARAEKSVRALMALAAPEASVVRGGERRRVATEELVPGDVLIVEAGDRIPADARIMEEANLYTDEAPLTGESLPVAKDAAPIAGDTGIGDRRNMLYSGTVATAGRWSSRPACAPRSGASPGCSSTPRRSRRRCSRSSTAPGAGSA